MTKAALTEAAWTMLREGWQRPDEKRTWKQITSLTTVNKAQLHRMTKAWERAQGWLGSSDGPKRDWAERIVSGTWKDALKALREAKFGAMDDNDLEDWREEKARKMAEYIRKGPSLLEHPEVTARALEMVSGQLPELLVDQWARDVIERLLAEAEAASPDKEAAFQAVREALGAADAVEWDAL
jgi:hypothetical protein